MAALVAAYSQLHPERIEVSEMVTVSIDPVIFSIGHFHLRWYSLIVMTAIATGVWLAAREAERRGFERAAIYDGALWIVPAGLVGARLFHVLDHWTHGFAAQPIRALYIWEGGLAIWGGVVGGLVAVVILAWSRGWRIARLLDAVAPGLVLAQAIGRTACIITGDAAGKPTTGPFGLAYTHPGASSLSISCSTPVCASWSPSGVRTRLLPLVSIRRN
jgi:phosphatidylglycerol:prolipoprotein diacylglycerol transferase